MRVLVMNGVMLFFASLLTASALLHGPQAGVQRDYPHLVSIHH